MRAKLNMKFIQYDVLKNGSVGISKYDVTEESNPMEINKHNYRRELHEMFYRIAATLSEK